MFAVKGRSMATNRKAPGIHANIRLGWKVLRRDKHSILFGKFISHEEGMFL